MRAYVRRNVNGRYNASSKVTVVVEMLLQKSNLKSFEIRHLKIGINRLGCGDRTY